MAVVTGERAGRTRGSSGHGDGGGRARQNCALTHIPSFEVALPDPFFGRFGPSEPERRSGSLSVPVPGTKTAKTFQFRAHPSNSWMWFVGFRYAIGYNL